MQPADPTAAAVVALDAMGGDRAPGATVAGALLAAGDGVRVHLVGDPAVLARELHAAGAPADALPITACSGAVRMEDDPALAVRGNRDASVRVAARLVAEGRAGAVVSAGSTGATLAAGLLELGRLPGVRRPAVAVRLPADGRRSGEVVLIDAGASPDVQAEALPVYARMGTAYARVLGADDPSVGLLNVGAESGKGSQLARDAEALLRGLPRFVGNVEPEAVLRGAADVVVTDGFTGNIFLKAVEALTPSSGVGPGAALLLGVGAPVLVAHGAADPQDVAAALRTAATIVAGSLVERLRDQLAAEAPVGGGRPAGAQPAVGGAPA